MVPKPRIGMPVAGEAKIMEARLDSHHEIRAGTAVAMDAGVEAPCVGIVVVAREAIDGHVLAMIEIQRQLLLTADEGLAQRNACAPGDHGREGEHCRPEDDGHEARMTAEREPAQRGLVARGLEAAPALQEQRHASRRHRQVQRATAVAAGVAGRRQHVALARIVNRHFEQRHEPCTHASGK